VSAVDRIGAQRVVPVIRCGDAADAVATARAAAAAGMSVVELTLTTPGVHDALRELRADDLTVGLGSVVRPGDVTLGVEAGARFVVTFGAVPGFVDAAREAAVPAVQGALTPSEVLAAHQAGADAVKIFPARVVPPAYLRDLRAVLPDVRLLPTGGIEPAGVAVWLDAGAWAVGLGGALGTAATVGAEEVTRRCRAALSMAYQERRTTL
jgi:2-dehydro-3-deoxyphosphogluconate aldolase/(4S)-4-hydroxy-2-oxoglutarate aldolase